MLHKLLSDEHADVKTPVTILRGAEKLAIEVTPGISALSWLDSRSEDGWYLRRRFLFEVMRSASLITGRSRVREA